MQRRRKALPVVLALIAAGALALAPLTAGGQEDGRAPNAKPGAPAAQPGAEPGQTYNGWDGDGPKPRTLVHSGDSTIQGGLCVGFDCSANEPMGFATIKIEENNLRIAAADSSTVSGFPTTDWQIEFNSSSSGGGNYFMVRDCGSSGAAGSVDSTCGGTPQLTIEGGADNESIHVDSSGNQGGNVGFGTANPVVDLHTLSGNTPTLRLEQDNSSGFTPQSWDLAGNESNFFIRDVTNGSALPFRIEPGTASNTLYLDNTESVGLNTTAPTATLNVRGISGNPLLGIKIEENVSGNTNLPTLIFENSNQGVVWRWQARDNGVFALQNLNTGGTVLSHETLFQPNGDVRIKGFLLAEAGDGALTATSCCGGAGGNERFPDYVFDTGYELMSVADLATFIQANGHLPGVMSAQDVAAEGAINMTLLQLQLLEKVEELALYTIGQHATIEELRAENAGLKTQLSELAARVEALGTR